MIFGLLQPTRFCELNVRLYDSFCTSNKIIFFTSFKLNDIFTILSQILKVYYWNNLAMVDQELKQCASLNYKIEKSKEKNKTI